MIRPLAIAACLTLAGCGTPAGVNPPSDQLMKRSPAADNLPAKTGMRQLYFAYIKLKAQYGRTRNREAGLQAYATAVSRK